MSSDSAVRILWPLFFLAMLIYSVLPIFGGTNVVSRWCTLAALAEDGTFSIDAYSEHTIDWSRTPDGHYYSNKAPAPALFAFPVYKAVDFVRMRGIESREVRDAIRFKALGSDLRILSLLLQAFPYCLIVWLWAGLLMRQFGVSLEAVAFFSLAALFGTTSTVFLNTFFGHGFTAVCALALLYAVAVRSWVAIGFFYGVGVLSDYSFVVYGVPLSIFLLREFRSRQGAVSSARLFVGALLPATLWVSYHAICFGSPFNIANKFQNPLFVDRASESVQLWGILGLPPLNVIFELIFGQQRGILWTQPWVLVVLPAALYLMRKGAVEAPDRRAVFSFSLVGFALCFFINACFGGWHGGDSPGPRYLAAPIAALTPLIALIFDRLSKRVRWTLIALIFVSMAWQLLFFSVYDLPKQGSPLWRHYWSHLNSDKWMTPAVRLATTLPVVTATVCFTMRRVRRAVMRRVV